MSQTKPFARLLVVAGLAAALVAGMLVTSPFASAEVKAPKASEQRLYIPRSYTPAPPGGGTDDYHCTMVTMKQAGDVYITGSQFHPGSKVVHHAIMYLVDPSAANEAKILNRGGKGWTCFGETSIGKGAQALAASRWLTAWAPSKAKGIRSTPKGTGMLVPKGSVLVMQIHYNTLQGKRADRSSLTVRSVPAKGSKLKPLMIRQIVAPPDVPCPAGVTGPLCDREASIANTKKRFGDEAVAFINTIERVCGRDPENPPASNSTTCTWPVWADGTLLTVAAHMHLTGRAFSLVLNPGTPEAKTLLKVKNYNFDDQGAITLRKSVALKRGDRLQVNCTWDPKLRQRLPQLKKQPARFVTWGAGSSDEMCLGVLGVTSPKTPAKAPSFTIPSTPTA